MYDICFKVLAFIHPPLFLVFDILRIRYEQRKRRRRNFHVKTFISANVEKITAFRLRSKEVGPHVGYM